MTPHKSKKKGAAVRLRLSWYLKPADSPRVTKSFSDGTCNKKLLLIKWSCDLAVATKEIKRRTSGWMT